jgi:hypothetical protein
MRSLRGKCNVTASTKQRLSEARNQVLQASRLLVSPAPESLDRCALLLETATTSVAAYHAELTALPDAISRVDQTAIEELRQLQRAIGLVKLLLDTAFQFHRHWARRLGMMTRGYTSDGEPAPVEHGSRVLGRG